MGFNLLSSTTSFALPPMFADTPIVNDLVLPTAMTFLPDGRMLVIQKNGEITIVEDPKDPQTAIERYMTITDIESGENERGLMNIVLDPDFANNGHFYMYYSKQSTMKFRVARFTHQENTGGLTSRGDLNSELMIWEDNEPVSSCCHYGGGLDFAPDGTLFLSVGEEFDAQQAQNLGRAGGKVHRFHSDGSIPSDNPYFDGSPGILNAAGQLQSVYSYGMRNPFRGRFDSPTNRFIIGEVGGNDHSTAREDIHVAASGVDMGWPQCEGDCFPPGSPGNPIFSYPHSGSGASVTGGIVYRGTQFPNEYRTTYFYGDWVRKWIRYLEFDYSQPSIPVVADHAFTSTGGQPLAFAQGPDGELYYIETNRSGTVFQFLGSVRRITFEATNQSPVCTSVQALPPSGPQAPLTVNFSASVSDPESDTLTYEWFLGDGTTSNEEFPQHTYTTNGQYRVELFVSDPQKTTVCDPIQITVGTPPTVTIASPIDGSLFLAGDTITAIGTAIDGQGNPISPSQMTWSVVFIHNEHVHPVVSPTTGTGVNFQVEREGHDFSDTTGFEIFLTATGTDGLQRTTSAKVWPTKVNLNLQSTPVDEMSMSLDTIPRTTPRVHDTLVNFMHEVAAPTTQCVRGQHYQFSNWSDNGAATHNVVVPSNDSTLTAVYNQQGLCATQALAFNGTVGIDIPDLTLTGDFTVEFWSYLESGQTISEADGIVTNGQGSQDINFHVSRIRLHSSDGGWDRIVANTPTTAGQWTHYAFVRQNGLLSLSINGIVDVTSSSAWNGDFMIAELGRAVAGHLHGRLDEVRIWSLARSATAIAANYERPLAGSTAGLVAYYNFEGQGNTVEDRTGQGAGGPLPDTGATRVTPGAPLNSTQLDNQLPTLTNPGAQTHQEGTVVNLALTAIDPDGDPLTYSATNLPSGLSINASTGMISGTLAANSANTYAVTVRVTDNRGGEATAVLTWTVTSTPPVNQPPVLTNPRNQTHQEGDAINVALTATDPDGDPLTFSATNLPTGLSINATTGMISGTLPANSANTYAVNIRVTDSQGSEDTAAFIWTVTATQPMNYALTLNGTVGIDIPDLTLTGDFTVEFWSYLESGQTISEADGIVTNGQGSQDINFHVSRIRLHSSDGGWDRIVANTPTTAGQWTHYAFVRQNGLLSLSINGIVDVTSSSAWNGDFMIAELGRAVAGHLHGRLDEVRIWSLARSATAIAANYERPLAGSTAGLVAYYDFEGQGNIVEDRTGQGAGGPLPDTGATRVTPGAPLNSTQLDNQLPTLTNPGAQTHQEGTVVNLALTAIDPDGDPLTYSATNLPSGLSINASTGMISGTLAANSANTYAVTVRVTDNRGGEATAVLTWTVTSTPPVNQPPVLTNPRNQTHQEGDAINVALTATDPDGDPLTFSATNLPTGLSINATTGMISGTLPANSANTYAVNIRVTDSQGSEDTAAFIWTVTATQPMNYALTLNGTVGIDIPDLTLTGDFTVEFWSYLESGQTISEADGIVTNGQGSQDINFHVSRIRLHSSDGGWDRIVANTPTTAGQWTHYAFVRQNGLLSLSINGIVDVTSSSAWNGDFMIAELGRAVAGHLHGRLDEVRIWSLARSATAIAANYERPLAGSTAGLVAYYNFEGQGNTVEDRTGQGAGGPLPDTGATRVTPGAPLNSTQLDNQLPTLTNPGAQTHQEGTVVNLALTAIDPDGDPLTYSATNLPSGLSINASTGMISGTLAANSANTYAVTVRVTDNRGGEATAVLTWTVTSTPPVNQPPVLTNPRNQTHQEGDAINVALTATDPDGDPLTFSATNLPTGLSINATTGMISGTLPANSANTYAVNIRVTDSQGSEDTAAFIWTVTATQPMNYALTLNGTVGIDIPDLTLTGDFTVEFWSYLESGQTISEADGIVTNGQGSQDINFHVSRIRLHSSDGGWDRIVANTPTTAGQWTHYAFVRQNGLLSLSINGIVDVTSSSAWNGDFMIAELGRAVAGHLHGRLDEVRIWSLARSATAIAANYERPLAGSTAGLVAYYNFEGQGNTVEDRTGQGAGGPLPDTGATRVTPGAPLSQ